MKFPTVLLLLLITVLLSACDDQAFDYAYTASGEGNQERDLREDAQFSSTDDLNVVIKLNPHDAPIQVEARFMDPNQDLLESIEAEAGAEVGTLVMGIDYAARADQGSLWSRGRYRVDILLDGEQVETLYFRVD